MALVILTVSTADTTPDVSSLPDLVKITYGSSLTITDFDNGVEAQEVKLLFSNNQITIQHNANIVLSGGVDFTSGTNFIIQLISDGTTWYEKCRSVISYS